MSWPNDINKLRITSYELRNKDIFRQIKAVAEPVYGEREARAIARLVAEKVSASDGQTGAAPVPLRGGVSAKQTGWSCRSADIAQICNRISRAEPVQYILGTADFYNLCLAVGQGVLIPRPETEELVRWIIDVVVSSRSEQSEARDLINKGIKILDIGTGSGAIAIALAKNLPGAQVTGIDISTEALDFARRNSDKYSAGVDFFGADIFELVQQRELAGQKNVIPKRAERGEGYLEYDIIVSNPPYIPASERELMHDNVTRWEPASSLFVPDDDPLIFYRAIARFARRALAPRGALYFEIHEDFAEPAVELLHAEGFSQVVVREDLNSKPRMIKAVK